ncbi:hypothetical protein [Corallincola spongiicola]|uniref:Uncharacterized protein n=1 Tax=Corallincola spongiicola TaxID=2520508 RepID=A0ABY1WT02_9GAMM|nr:hypothetical protein [Corallincola spongiicola]TAA47879.1 hypothetical protein EXY25_01120 [Corallincola spongiicola]
MAGKIHSGQGGDFPSTIEKGHMLNLTAAIAVSICNLVYAAVIYLSLHGWLVAHDPGGMQLLIHLIITTPVIVITTIWLYFVTKTTPISAVAWKLNLAAMLIPVMSLQTGVTYYHFDIVGLGIAVFTALSLFGLYIKAVAENLVVQSE